MFVSAATNHITVRSATATNWSFVKFTTMSLWDARNWPQLQF